MRETIRKLVKVLADLFFQLNIWIGLLLFSAILTGYCIIAHTVFVPVEIFYLAFFVSLVAVLLLFCEEERYRALAPPPKMSLEHREAAYPEPPERWLHDTLPDDCLPLGTWRGHYVCQDLNEDTNPHWAIIASTGGGKTSCFLANLLLMMHSVGGLFFDPKSGELVHLFVRHNDPDVYVINPRDRSSCGYDMLFALHNISSPSLQQVADVFEEIIQVLVPLIPDAKEPMWGNLARSYLQGTMTYAYYHLHKTNIIDIIDWIKSMTARRVVQSILKNTAATDYSHQLLVNFAEMPNETFGSVISEAEQGMAIFSHADIRYCLRENPVKCSPLDIEAEKRIFVSISIKDMAAFRILVRAIINQTISQLMERDLRRIDRYKPAILLIEEASMLLEGGPIPSLITAVKELRGFKTRIIMTTQVIESMRSAYTEEAIIDLFSNMNLIVLNGGKSMRTLQMISDLAMQYHEKEKSYSENGGKGGLSTRYTEKPVITPGEINQLGDDCILLTDHDGYMRIRKLPYYKDPYLSKRAKEIREYNETIWEIQEQSRQLQIDEKKEEGKHD